MIFDVRWPDVSEHELSRDQLLLFASWVELPHSILFVVVVVINRGTYAGYVEHEIGVTASAEEAPSPLLGSWWEVDAMPYTGEVIVLLLCCGPNLLEYWILLL